MPTSGMAFTVLPRGTAHPAPPVEPVKLPRLGKVWREETRPGCWETVQAATEDGEWLFERQGSTWAAGHLPSKTALKNRLGSLRACRLYVGSGDALADLERIQAHDQTNAKEKTQT
jgi:hypothetical protein